MVTIVPSTIELTAPAAVLRRQKKTAMTAGVTAAPYTV